MTLGLTRIPRGTTGSPLVFDFDLDLDEEGECGFFLCVCGVG